MSDYQFIDEKGEHLHLLRGKPLTGTSSVVGVLNKPLSWWASGKAVEYLGWIHGKPKVNGRYVVVPIEERIKAAQEKYDLIKKGNCEDYVHMLDSAYANHSSSLGKSATKGTNLHAELEKYVKNCIHANGGTPLVIEIEDKIDAVKIFATWSSNNVKRFIASEGHCFSESLWLGGIIDCLAQLNDGTLAVIDFKSSREAYPSHFIQCALYAIQIEENGLISSDGKHSKKIEKNIDALIIIPFGAEHVVPEVRTNVEEYKKGGESALILYRLLGLDDRIKNK